MKSVYLDHAATTYIYPEVIDVISETLNKVYGNPSSTHSVGRDAKALVEEARKKIATLIGAQSKELLFNSGATEGNNWIIQQSIKSLGVTRIITSKMEHHAVLYPIKKLASEGVKVDYLNTLPNGSLDLNHLESLLQNEAKTLVSLMHINNETGIINPIETIGKMVKNHQAYFHADMVQSVGKYPINLKDLHVDFMVASAHKFHGPKGVGFVYVKNPLVLQSSITGGEQEKGYRAGTEAVHQIVGLAKALELSYEKLAEGQQKISDLKKYAIQKLEEKFPGVIINGGTENTTYNILNARLPITQQESLMLLFNLDLKGIALSKGSACQSGSQKPSHVLAEFLDDDALNLTSIRISFSEKNTPEDIDYLVACL